MLLGILLVLTLLLLVVSYFANNKSVIAPSVLFSAGFAASALCAFLYQGRWGFSVQYNTVLVIAGGIATFIISCALTRYAADRLRQMHRKKEPTENHSLDGKPKTGSSPLDVREPTTVAILILMAIDIATIIWMLAAIQKFFPDVNLSEAIRRYDSALKFSTKDVSFGFPLNQLKSLSLFTGYYLCFIVAYEIHTHKIRSLRFLASLTALLSTILLSLATGGREQAICYVFGITACYLLIRVRTGKGARLTPRTGIIALVVLGILLGVFQHLAIGRNIQQPFWDYIAEYLGAEIHNLNHFLNTTTKHNINVWGGMTFINLFNFIGDKLHIASLNYQLDLPFLTCNGYDMGNVYTTFYAFIYDFGYIGVPVLTAIMGAISQAIYELAAKGSKGTRADYWIAIYAFLAFQLLFCFFSNKFYENTFGDSAARLLVYVFVGRTFLLYCNKNGFKAARSYLAKLRMRVIGKDTTPKGE